MKMHENSMGCRFKNSYVAASKGVGHCGSLWDPLLWNVVESGCWLQSRIQHKGGSDPPVCAVCVMDLPKSSQSILNIRKI